MELFLVYSGFETEMDFVLIFDCVSTFATGNINYNKIVVLAPYQGSGNEAIDAMLSLGGAKSGFRYATV
jgi:hypothetical protein